MWSEVFSRGFLRFLVAFGGVFLTVVVVATT